MGKVRKLCAIAGLLLLVSPTSISSGRAEMIDEVSGSVVRAIQAAMPEAAKVMADIEEYNISVWDEDDVIAVNFHDRKADPHQMGSSGRVPDFTIELTKGDLRFIHLVYTR